MRQRSEIPAEQDPGAIKPPEFEDEASLFSLSSEYLEAASTLHGASHTKLTVSLVTFYLLGHAAELLLKSYLHKQGVPISELKNKYGHNLVKLIHHARERGLPKSLALAQLLQLAETYTPKQLEYRKNLTQTFPSVESLLHEVQELQQRVFDHIAELGAEAQ